MASSEKLTDVLTQRGIDTCYHQLIAELCGGKVEYVEDIEIDDIQGQSDSNGEVIPAAVARGIVRQLRSSSASGRRGLSASSSSQGYTETKKGDEPSRHGIGTAQTSSVGSCAVALRRGDGEYASMMRCTVRGKIGGDNGSTGGSFISSRTKILTAVLDNSYSMRDQWSLVVDAVARVYTDELLRDRSVSLNALTYNTEAKEVTLPPTSLALQNRLLRQFAPRGITNFKSAFKLAETIIRREVNNLLEGGVARSQIDVTTLIFTDGEDTSVPPLGYKCAAATTKAREAGDEFRHFLRGLGCSSYTCIAAFGEHHNPEQCQYLCDRYYYINRQEVLSDWLSGGLSDLLQGSGFCSMSVTLPGGVSLAEAVPRSIGLDSFGRFENEVWLCADSTSSTPMLGDDGEVKVSVEDSGSGSTALRGSASLGSAKIVHSNSLEGRIFLLDFGEMQLRQIATELRGRHPSPTELARLRERLAGVHALVQPVSNVANNVTARISGRAMLLARLDELETRRKRLSYALGHFEKDDQDTRDIGAVGIDAILRDASQRVPLGADATKHARRAEAAALLPAMEDLSEYGRRCTFDSVSGCDARQSAEHGNAMFFRLGDVTSIEGGTAVSASDQGDEPIPYDVFMLRGLEKQGFTHLGIPFFATAGHFLRVKQVLPDVLGHLSPDGNYAQGKSERLLLNLLGCSVQSHVEMKASSSSSLGLFHRARTVHAVFDCTEGPDGGTLLSEVLAEVETFIDKPEKRRGVKNLYEIAAVGLLAQEWPSNKIVSLAKAVVEESIRRVVASTTDDLSESERIHLAWDVLGGCKGDEWLQTSFVGVGFQPPTMWDDGFDILSAGAELEGLEDRAPGEYSPRNAGILSRILAVKPPIGTPPIHEWSSLLTLLSRWGQVAEEERSGGGLWNRLDAMMTDDSASKPEAFARLETVLRVPTLSSTLGGALTEPQSTLLSIARECTQGVKAQRKNEAKTDLPPRLELASVIKDMVNRRRSAAYKYPIVDSHYPSGCPMSPWELHSASESGTKAWGAPAMPLDKTLYETVRKKVHRKYFGAKFTVKEALTDKLYRQEGGLFAFPMQLDTFVVGLHRRTRDLHDAWELKGMETSGAEAKNAAVEEMLLRLRWDDRDNRARANLSRIVGRIWDGLEGVPSPGTPIPSALWIVDSAVDYERAKDPAMLLDGADKATAGNGGEGEQQSGEGKPQSSDKTSTNGGAGDDWDVVNM